MNENYWYLAKAAVFKAMLKICDAKDRTFSPSEILKETRDNSKIYGQVRVADVRKLLEGSIENNQRYVLKAGEGVSAGYRLDMDRSKDIREYIKNAVRLYKRKRSDDFRDQGF